MIEGAWGGGGHCRTTGLRPAVWSWNWPPQKEWDSPRQVGKAGVASGQPRQRFLGRKGDGIGGGRT